MSTREEVKPVQITGARRFGRGPGGSEGGPEFRKGARSFGRGPGGLEGGPGSDYVLHVLSFPVLSLSVDCTN